MANTELATAYISILPSTRGFVPSLSKQLGGAGGAMESTGRSLGNRFTSGLKVTAKAAGIAIGGVLTKALVGGFKRLTSIENAEAKLSGLGHSAKGVESIMTNALNAVKGTAFGMDEAATTAAGAVAAGIKPGKDLEGVLKLVGDAATIGGTSMSEMGAIFNKVASSNKIQGDVIAQLGDKGIPIIQLLAKQLGTTAEETVDLASKGKINFETFRKAMEDGMGGAALKSGDTTVGAFKNMNAALSRFGVTLLEKVFPYIGPAMKSATDAIDAASEKVGPVLDTIAAGIEGVFQILVNGDFTSAFAQAFNIEEDSALVDFLFTVRENFIAVGAYVRDHVVPALQSFGGWIVGTGIPAIVSLVGWLSQNRQVLAVIAGVIGTLMIPALIRWGVQSTINGAKAVAAFVLTKTEAIRTAAVFLVQSYKMIGQWVLMGAAAIKSGAQTVAIWTMYKIESAKAAAAMIAAKARVIASWVAMGASAVASGIKTAAVWTAQIVASAATGAAQFAISAGRVVGGWVLMGAQSLLHAARMAAAWVIGLGPVGWAIAAIVGIAAVVVANWDKISSWTKKAWGSVRTALSNFGNWIKTTFANAINWIYTSLFKPVWDKVKSITSSASTAIKDTMAKVSSWVRNTFGPAFTWLRDSIIKPVWDKVGGIIKGVWKNTLKPVFDVLKSVVKGDIPGAFRTAKDAVDKHWKAIKKIASGPVDFVINRVVNDGLIGNFNKIASKIGIKTLPRVEFKGFATGGYTGPGHKYKEAGVVHAGEFVIKKSTTRKLRQRYGLSALNRLNETGEMPGYATGGLVRRPVGGPVTSGFGASRGKYPHAGIDFAVPVGTPVRAALAGRVVRASWNAVTGRTGKGMLLAHEGGGNTYYGHLSAFAAKVGDLVKQGQVIAKSGNTGRSTGPHLHFETWSGGKPINPASVLGGLMPTGGNSVGGGGGFSFADLLSKVPGFKQVKELASGISERVKSRFPGAAMFGEAAIGTAKNLASSTYNMVKDKVMSWAQTAFGNVGEFVSDAVHKVGSAATKAQVRAVAATYGWAGGDQWNALSSIIAKESGWNPKAANPRSSARGLFQKMTSLHGPIERTATGQARWGLRYIKDRYGDPLRAWAHWQRHKSYAKGGTVTPTLYDGGGWLHDTGGPQLIDHQRRKPDAVLTNEEWRSMHRIAESVGEGGEPSVHIGQVVIPASDLAELKTVTDFVEALRRKARQR